MKLLGLLPIQTEYLSSPYDLWLLLLEMMNAINSRKKTQLKAQVKQSIRTIYLQFSTEHKCNWKDISDKKLVSLSSSKFRARGGFSGVSFGDQPNTYIFQKTR